MKKLISITFLLIAPFILLAQVSKYEGKYKAISFSLFGAEKMRSNFEVSMDGTIKGDLRIGENEEQIFENLKGSTNEKGKFEAQQILTDGTILSIKGNLPLPDQTGTISFTQKTIRKGGGKKSVSESGTSGFIARLPNDQLASVPEIMIKDNGRTYLVFSNTNILFTKEWQPDTTNFSITSYETKTFKVIEIKESAGDTLRRFRFALTEEEGKKIWLAEEGFSTSYWEKKGAEIKNFMYKQSGKIELVSENSKEIVFKISNLQLMKTENKEVVRIDGYIHALKTQ